jgi:hypothetical protein
LPVTVKINFFYANTLATVRVSRNNNKIQGDEISFILSCDVPDPRHFEMDPALDPDPPLFASGFQDTNKK